MSRELPAVPNLEHLKKQAKQLLRQLCRGDSAAGELFAAHAPVLEGVAAKLADAQHVLAREYGFTTWAELKQHVEGLAAREDAIAAMKAAVQANDARKAADILARHPVLKARINEPWPGSAFGETALHVAVRRANREMIGLFLSAGADINKRSDWWAGGFSVLDESWREPWLPAFLIERGAKLDVHSAARLGMLGDLKSMIAAAPSLVHARGGDGQTPLHFAQSVEAAEFLLAQGAEIDAQDVDHESTPAQYMIRDRQEIARYLVQRGCRTDILMASALGDLALVQKHLDADPSAIRTSVSREYFPMQNKRAGGAIYIWTLGQNKTAHVIAREFHHEHVFELLMDRSPDELKLALACERGEEEICRDMLARNPNLVKTLTSAEQRKLADAAQANNDAAVRLMLDAGWPADARGQHGATALHWAGFHGNARMARAILRHHPPLETPDADYNGTPLGWTIHGSSNGWHRDSGDYVATLEALLTAGAKIPAGSADDASLAVRAVLGRYIKQ